MSCLTGKKIVISGGTGMIGRHLIRLCKEHNVNSISSLSLDDTDIEGVDCHHVDLTQKYAAFAYTERMDYVFHLAGIKSNPSNAKSKPASFSVPMIQFNTNFAEAALKNNVEWYLYTSSVGVYAQTEEFIEDDVWKTFPSENDKAAGWAKRMGELQLESYQIEYGWNKYSIIRPTNIFGEFDCFNPKDAMIVPTLIYKMINFPTQDLELHGDGSNIRDLLYAGEIARCMVHMVENKINGPLNCGTGIGISIKELVEKLIVITGFKGGLKWLGGPSGDKKRIMNIKKLQDAGFEPESNLDKGLELTVEWYKENKDKLPNRYEPFKN